MILSFCCRAPEKFNFLFEGLQSTKSGIQDSKTEILVGTVCIFLSSDSRIRKKVEERMNARDKAIEERMDARYKAMEERMDARYKATEKLRDAYFYASLALSVLALILPWLRKS